MALLDQIRAKATSLQKRIYLPEGNEERNLKAAAEASAKGYAKITLVGNADEINAKAKEFGADISKCTIIDPATDENKEKFAKEYFEIRKHKGMTEDKAAETMLDPIFYSAMSVRLDEADGYVSGAVHSTGDVLRAAIQVIGCKEGTKTISSNFIMILPEGSPFGVDGVLMYADCGVVPNPNAEQLSDIAISTADSFRKLVGAEPCIGMLSFSTKGSAKHEDIDKVIEATKLVKEKAPELQIDGELQVDAALVESVGKSKAPGSPVAGKANVLIFPDLDAGNIAYKLTQRLANAVALGPLVQGTAKPINDLSRGCSFEDIVDVICITACQGA